jgi:hypothetical protein
VYALQFGMDGVLGLQNGGIETVDIGQLESKDAQRVRIRWYVGLALMRDIAAARITGVNAS